MSSRSFRGVRIIRFGEFELEVRSAELRRSGVKVRLQEQPFRILLMLVERPGEVVYRDEIRKRLWPNGTAVEVSHGINAAVQRLREALGESADSPQYVETLARRGYRFITPVELVVSEGAGRPAGAVSDSRGYEGNAVSHFRVLEKLGGGGMGVVHRAEDLKLGRQVALKFLPPDVANDPAALGRFLREARAASALNHPNICTTYGVEECDGRPVIVMELLEGETLEAMLAKGPLAPAEALAGAIEIASALDAAHRKGIIHRDLKPGNLLSTRSGWKVLDFGLAKMERSAGLSFEAVSQVTQEGAILGTLHYLSPEQVQGRETDARSDMFSFGVVLYEMLAGRHAFDGPNPATVMASILTLQPAPLPPEVPVELERVVRRCLAKDPDERWQTARDLKAALELLAAGRPAAQTAPLAAPSARGVLPWRLVAVAAAVISMVIAARFVWKAGVSERPNLPAIMTATRLEAAPLTTARMETSRPKTRSGLAETGYSLEAPGGAAVTRLSVSPDARRIAFLAGDTVYVRSLNPSDSRILYSGRASGTPFWSPDGGRIAFNSRGALQTAGLAGGAPSLLCEINTTLAGAWGPGGAILIGARGDGLFRIPTQGGQPVRLTALDSSRHETRHLLPQFLPDKRFLFVAGSDRPGESMLYVGSLDSSTRSPVMPMSSNVQFVPTSPGEREGYLLFCNDGALLAKAFDIRTLQASGPALVVADSVGSVAAAGAQVSIADFSAAGSVLAYRTRGAKQGAITVVENWMGKLGR